MLGERLCDLGGRTGSTLHKHSRLPGPSHASDWTPARTSVRCRVPVCRSWHIREIGTGGRKNPRVGGRPRFPHPPREGENTDPQGGHEGDRTQPSRQSGRAHPAFGWVGSLLLTHNNWTLMGCEEVSPHGTHAGTAQGDQLASSPCGDYVQTPPLRLVFFSEAEPRCVAQTILLPQPPECGTAGV